MRKIKIAAALAALLAVTAAYAVEPDEMLADPKLEARAEAIGAELRCVVCQSESIEESGAPIAGDMRRLVRERIKAGDSDAEVKAYLVARYGNYVLMRPPLAPETLALWAAPILALGLGAAAALIVLRRPAATGGDAADDPVTE